ncbi:MAG: alpha-1,2-fucosyltransferase [Planctomycetota bacterium]
MITFPGIGYHGRLGNQMFQYAMLVGVAERCGHEVVIPEDVLTGFELTARRQPRDLIPEPQHRFDESVPAFCFDRSVWGQPDGTGYSGYFQSYRYFEKIEDQVRNEFAFTHEIRLRAKCLVDQVVQQAVRRPIVGVHVRRGDYLNLTDYHRPFDLNYFQDAANAMRLDNALFVVFSDDMPWVREHIPSQGGQSVFHLDEPNPMVCLCVAATVCQHYICSASSYGWWAAWLGTAKDKRVVIPSPWYGPGYGTSESQNEMSPPEWIRMEQQSIARTKFPKRPKPVLRHCLAVCETCQMARARDSNSVFCGAAGDRVSPTHDRCRLRKWSV